MMSELLIDLERSSTTGYDAFSGRYEYGLMDELNGISFADALQKSDQLGGTALRLVEGAEIHTNTITFNELLEVGLLNFAVQLPHEQLILEFK